MARRDDREYREYLREEQRSQPGCPAREVVLDQRGRTTGSRRGDRGPRASLAAPASALELVITDLRTPAAVVMATIDVRDVLPDRFQAADRRRHGRASARRGRALGEPAGVGSSRLPVDRPCVSTRRAPCPAAKSRSAIQPDRHESIRRRRIRCRWRSSSGIATASPASAKCYVHVMATLGTLAEKDADEVGDAVFGRESDSTGLGAIGRRLFRTVIKVSDYLQSVSAGERRRRGRRAAIC